jgi:hypothetical protein
METRRMKRSTWGLAAVGALPIATAFGRPDTLNLEDLQ